MIVTVALHAGLSQYLPPGTQDRRVALELPEGETVRDALTRLGVPDDIPRIPVLDGRVTAEDTVLQPGQSLRVFPPLAGGIAPDRSPIGGVLYVTPGIRRVECQDPWGT